jgi:cytochrome c-type biogenesis protein CcmH
MSRALALTLLLIAAAATLAAAPVSEQTVHDIGAQLRCVVCQSLSVADSPSETANQMRGIIRERLAAGDSPEQVKAYFVRSTASGSCSPPRQGFNLLVWWRRLRPSAPAWCWCSCWCGAGAAGPPGRRRPAPDAAMRARIHREMAEREP